MQLMDITLTIPLTNQDRKLAENFANQFTEFPRKQEQVYHNILATCAVKNYLKTLDILTDTKRSYSYNPALQLVENIADLYLPEIGRLECRYLKPNQQTCHIPAETWSDRIGYVAVEIDPDNHQAKLLGFIKQVTTEEIPIDQLQPLDDLLETIAEIELEYEALATVSHGETIFDKPKITLTQWLSGIFTETWDAVEQLLTPRQLGLAHFSEQVKRAKRLDLKIDLITHSVILVINLDRENLDKIGVKLQVYSPDENVCLPEGLELLILAEGEVFQNVIAREADQLMQCSFEADSGDEFTLELRLNQVSFKEDFVV
jgi:hypothetical protein